MRCFRMFNKEEYIRAYILRYIVELLSEPLYSPWINFDEVKYYGLETIDKIAEYAEKDYIEIESVKKTVIDFCSELRNLINTGELLSYINPENELGVKWAKQNVIKRKCKKCSREFISITDEALVYLLENYYIFIPEDWLHYCPKCVHRIALSRFILKHHRDKIRYKRGRFRTQKKYKEAYEKLISLQKRGKQIYSLQYKKFSRKVRDYPSIYLDNLIKVLRVSEQIEDKEKIKNSRTYKIEYLLKTLAYKGPSTIDELAKILAEKYKTKTNSAKRWIREVLQSRNLEREIIFVVEKHKRTIKIDASPIAILRAILYLLCDNDSLKLFRLPDIYFYLKRHGKRYFIPIINTLFELHYDGGGWIGEPDRYIYIYNKMNSRDTDPNLIRWNMFENTIYKIFIKFVDDTFKLRNGFNYGYKAYRLDLKYLAIKFHLVYEQTENEGKNILDKAIRYIYNALEDQYGKLQDLKREFEKLLYK